MAQHDMNIANQGFPATRSDINNALQAIATNNSGTSAPSTTFANQWWYDEANNKLYIRNEANNAWIQVAVLDQTNNEWQITTGVVQAKDSDGLALKTDDGTTRLFIKDSDGDIGIQHSSPDENLHIKNASGSTIVKTEVAAGSLVGFEIKKTGSTTQHWRFADGISANGRLEIYDVTDSRCVAAFHGNGGVSLASNSTSSSVDGFAVEGEGDTYITCEGVEGRVLMLNRKSSDGDLIEFRKDNGEVGAIAAIDGDILVGTGTCALRFNDAEENIFPVNIANLSANANAVDMGRFNVKFADFFGVNSAINTSDENEKQNIASLTSAEITAATAISKLFKTYKWKDQVEAKGDKARTHTGIVAQQVQTAMSDAGLDASKYAFWCSNTWWEKNVEVAAVEGREEQEAVYDENGHLVTERVKAKKSIEAFTRTDTYDSEDEAPEGSTEITRMGVRYPELLAFIGAATEQRLTSIEARLTALEG